MSSRDSDLERLAHHEAGHIVADVVLNGSSARSVTIERNESRSSLGYAMPEPSLEIYPRVRDYEMIVIAFFAGLAAEIRFDSEAIQDPHAQIGHRADDLKASRWLTLLGGAELHEDRLRDETTAFVEAHWDGITRLASELIAHGTLNHDECEMIIEIVHGEGSEWDLAQYRMLRDPL